MKIQFREDQHLWARILSFPFWLTAITIGIVGGFTLVLIVLPFAIVAKIILGIDNWFLGPYKPWYLRSHKIRTPEERLEAFEKKVRRSFW